MAMIDRRDAADELQEIAGLARPFHGANDLDPLLDRVGDSRFVLIGEASHGTSEYYQWRAELTRRLVTERDFSFIAVEGDWPDCYVVNRWVKGLTLDGLDSREVLEVFGRWPTWMWANEEVANFIAWLKEHNQSRGTDVGFYGLDVYSLWESMRRITAFLAENQPDALASATEAYRCFEPYGEDPQRYASATRMVPTDCEDEVIDLLREVREDYRSTDAEAEFDALQNAEVLAGAERYYRTMVRGDGQSWNVRDIHMSDTLDRLIEHHGDDAKAVVWEHNTHVGDARATDMARAGMVNVGQLARERHSDEGVVLIGLGSHRGSVIAARSWGDDTEEFPVPPAPPDTHEDLVHANGEQALFVFPDDRDSKWLSTPRGHRAIGVVYNPATDHRGNWVRTVMGQRYDAFMYFDKTRALRPLGVEPRQEEVAGTYPWGR